MSVYASTYVWDQSKQGGSKLVVMLALADYANPETGESWPGIAALAEKCRMTTRYLRKILNDLEEAGEIKRIHGKGQETETGTTNRYILCGYQAWRKRVKELKATDEGVNNDSPHDDQGVNYSSARGEQEYREGVNNDSPKPLVEPLVTVTSSSADTRPAKTTRTKSKDKRKTNRPAVEFNPLKDAIVVAFGWKPDDMTRQAWGKVDRAAAELYDAGRRADDVPALYRYCQRNYDKFGPNALAGAVPEVAKQQTKSKILTLEPVSAEPPDTTAEYFNYAGVSND